MHHFKHALRQWYPFCNRRTGYVLSVLAMLMPMHVNAQDIFTGMIVTDGTELVLERCHVGKTRYRLSAAPDADGGDPLAQLRGNDGLLQAEIIARYRAEGEAHGLEVLSVERIMPGKTCHLIEAVEAAFFAQEPAPDLTERADRWEALAAGADATAGTETIGSGPFAYRFTLLHPRTGMPVPDTDYAISASRATDYELPFVADAKKVYQGRTDAEGRTPVFRLPVRLPDAAFDLRERFGSGAYGETFHLTDHNGNDLFNTPYVLVTCTAPPRLFRGYTYPNGDTAYTASDGPINIQLFVLDTIDEPLLTSCEDERRGDRDYPQVKLENGKVPTGESKR
jgi:hypothetical protein